MKNLCRLLHGNNDDHFYMNCLHSFRRENKHKLHQNVCKNHDYCNIKMSETSNKMLNP